MKNILTGLMVLIFLVACGAPVNLNVKLDTTVANELPKSIAIDFLNKVSSASDVQLRARSHGYNESQQAVYKDKYRCTFGDKGLTMNHITRHGHTTAIIPYDALNMVSIVKGVPGTWGEWGYHLEVTSSASLRRDKSDENYYICSMMIDLLPGIDSSKPPAVPRPIVEKASKVASALKSLGVHINQDK